MFPPITDPILELIEAHRRARTALMTAMKTQNRFEKCHGAGAGNWVTTQPCHRENDVFEELAAASATTPSGLLAKIEYFHELATDDEWAWIILDPRDEGTTVALFESLAASLKNVGVLS
jgi:hypothetical protein